MFSMWHNRGLSHSFRVMFMASITHQPASDSAQDTAQLHHHRDMLTALASGQLDSLLRRWDTVSRRRHMGSCRRRMVACRRHMLACRRRMLACRRRTILAAAELLPTDIAVMRTASTGRISAAVYQRFCSV